MESGTFAVDPEPWGPPWRPWSEIDPDEAAARGIHAPLHALSDSAPGAIVIAPGDIRGTLLIPTLTVHAATGTDRHNRNRVLDALKAWGYDTGSLESAADIAAREQQARRMAERACRAGSGQVAAAKIRRSDAGDPQHPGHPPNHPARPHRTS